MVAQVAFNGLITGLILALPAIALTLTYSILRFPNFAIGAMMTVGAYLAFVLNVLLHWPLLAAAVLSSIFLAAILSLADRAVFSPLRNRSSITLLVASIGLSFVLENVVRLIFGNTARSFDMQLGSVYEFGVIRANREQAFTAAAALTAMIAVYIILAHTSLGRAMRAVADNPSLAAVRGLDGEQVIRKTWVVTGLLIGASGVLAGIDRAIDPQLGWSYLISVFAAAILGGLGSPLGAVLGAVSIGVAEEMSTLVISPNYREATGFFAITVILLLRPQGILGTARLRK